VQPTSGMRISSSIGDRRRGGVWLAFMNMAGLIRTFQIFQNTRIRND
jgi:hypothetical protein